MKEQEEGRSGATVGRNAPQACTSSHGAWTL